MREADASVASVTEAWEKPRRDRRFILARGLRRDSLSWQRRQGEVQDGRLV